MQSLEQMTNVQKAKLLHDIFPTEISGFITYAENMCETIIEQKDQLTAKWDNPFITANYWIGIAESTIERIRQKRHHLERSSKVFAEQLFSNLDALVLVHSLQQYTQHDRKHPNRKFTLAIDLLFNP